MRNTFFISRSSRPFCLINYTTKHSNEMYLSRAYLCLVSPWSTGDTARSLNSAAFSILSQIFPKLISCFGRGLLSTLIVGSVIWGHFFFIIVFSFFFPFSSFRCCKRKYIRHSRCILLFRCQNVSTRHPSNVFLVFHHFRRRPFPTFSYFSEYFLSGVSVTHLHSAIAALLLSYVTFEVTS